MANLYIPRINKTVFYDEVDKSPRESFSNNNFQVQRTLQCKWDDRWLLCLGLLGFPYTLYNLADGKLYVHRITPAGYQTVDLNALSGGNLTWIYPVSIDSIEGLGKVTSVGADGINNYELARLNVRYETLTYGIKTDQEMVEKGYKVYGTQFVDESKGGRYITRHLQPTAEYLTLPFGAMVWCDSGKNPITGSNGRIIASQEIMMQWHQVPGIPVALNTHLGAVNHRIFPYLDTLTDFQDDGSEISYERTYPRGTLLLTSIEVKPYRWFKNLRLYDITYKFRYFQPVEGLDTSTDAQGVKLGAEFPGDETLLLCPKGEPYGNNHFLRYKPVQGSNNFTIPSYQMMTHNGVRPTATGLTVTTQAGQTVYPYKDFRDLFTLTTAMEY